MKTAPLTMVLAAALALAGCSTPSTAGVQAAAPIGSPAVLSVGEQTSAASAPPAPATVTPGSISAQATGTVTGTPDVVTIGLGVETRGATATAALDDNSKRANSVVTVLKASGILPADLQTSGLSVNPSTDNSGRITGYQVTNMVTATVRNVASAGALIDAVAKVAGDAVRVQQLSFSIADDSALRAAARTQAVKRAQAQAKQMADAAGVRLGRIRSITEVPETNTSVDEMRAAAAPAASGAAPVEAGSQQLDVVVDVVYDIAQP